MKRLLASLSVASLVAAVGGDVTAAGSAPKPPAKNAPTKTGPAVHRETHAEMLKRSAPGDEYFGRMKMSYLGINNTLHDESVRAGDNTIDTGIINTVSFAEDALRDWQRKYPRDPQLARTIFLMGKMYTKIWTAQGQGRAAFYLMQLRDRYPSTYFGKLIKQQLAKGFTEHILADALPCPTPAPTDSPTPSPQPRGYRPTPTPAPTPSDTPSPTPSASPTPSPMPTAPPNSNIKIVIEPVPCFTPKPSPTPTPIATPTPVATPSILPSGIPPSPPVVTTPAPHVTPSIVPSGSPPSPIPSGNLTPVPSPSPVPTRR